jgi:hypothetical protein
MNPGVFAESGTRDISEYLAAAEAAKVITKSAGPKGKIKLRVA